MRSSDRDRIIDAAHAEAMRLVSEGVDPEQAVEWAVDLAMKGGKRLGVGQIEIVEKGKELVSPWLWILSVIGFLMAVTNTSRIAKIYGSWKAGRKAVKAGKAPEIEYGGTVGRNPGQPR